LSVRTLFDKCPVCKKGVVRKPEAKSFFEKVGAALNSGKYICDNCDSSFTYTKIQPLTNFEFYKLNVAKEEKNKKHDGRNLSLHEWNVILKNENLDLLEWVEKTNNLPKMNFDIEKFILDKNESSVWYGASTLCEERMIRKYDSGHAGIRLAKGIYVGKSVGHAESHPELKQIDAGELMLTTQRLMFNGQYKNYSIKLKDINFLDKWTDAIEVGKKSRQKTMVLGIEEPDKWFTLTQKAIQKL